MHGSDLALLLSFDDLKIDHHGNCAQMSFHSFQLIDTKVAAREGNLTPVGSKVQMIVFWPLVRSINDWLLSQKKMFDQEKKYTRPICYSNHSIITGMDVANLWQRNNSQGNFKLPLAH